MVLLLVVEEIGDDLTGDQRFRDNVQAALLLLPTVQADIHVGLSGL